MCALLQETFGNPAHAAIISIFVGATITWLVTWHYYKKAGNDLKKEAALLRKANVSMIYMLEHPDVKMEIQRDQTGNPIGIIVPASGHADGKSTVKGCASDEHE
jgi:hypothetical protein